MGLRLGKTLLILSLEGGLHPWAPCVILQEKGKNPCMEHFSSVQSTLPILTEVKKKKI
jgi:hypothetical protein